MFYKLNKNSINFEMCSKKAKKIRKAQVEMGQVQAIPQEVKKSQKRSK